MNHSNKLFLAAVVSIAGVLGGATDAQAQVECCLRGTTAALNAINNNSKDVDEKFFTVQGAPPNLMFLLDTSCSMNDLAVPPSVARSGMAALGCANPTYDAISAAGVFNQLAPLGTYKPPDLGVDPVAWNGDTGFPNLFLEDRFYRGREWDENGGTARTATDACLAVASGNRIACETCLNTKGYYLDPGSSSNNRQIFSGKFLNYYPPKYVSARTVMKRVLWNLRSVRTGLSVFDGNGGADFTSAGMSPGCDKAANGDTGVDPDWTNSRKSLINTLNNSSKVKFSGSTPLAEALFNVGQHFTSDDSIFDGWFGTGWTRDAFRNGSLTSQNRSVCWSCQVTSVVVITDGAPNEDNCVPECIAAQDPTCAGCDQQDGPCGADRGPAGNSGSSCPNKCTATQSSSAASCNTTSTSNCCVNAVNRLDGVAKWFYEKDLQTKPAGGLPMDGTQRMVTYTVGFGVDHPLLKNTAAVAGGLYFTANDATALEAALLSVVSDVNKRSTTFGVSSISTLQTSSGINAVVPRFQPGRPGEDWRGFLWRFSAINETTNGCVQTTPPAVPDSNDIDGDGKCNKIFYTDSSGAPVEEDPVTGLFVRRSSGLPAVPVWEAGRVLTYVNPTYAVPETASKRNMDTRSMWTIVDSNVDGKLDTSDNLVEFKVSNAATLQPYMHIPNDITDDPFCSAMYTKLGVTAPKSTWGIECTKSIIQYYRGKDAFNIDPTKRGLTRDWVLGDIFHSSPVTVEAPVGVEACGLVGQQCLTSVLTYAGKLDTTARAAYQAYVDTTTGPCGGGIECEKRRNYVLVGSNSGWLHAFDSGGVLDGTRDPLTNRYNTTPGTGEELWAFMPADLLGSLKGGVEKHGYFMDGTAMVRDVWVDGNGTLGNGNGVKETAEFHTVAVMGERGGGSHFFALDLTKNMNTFGAASTGFDNKRKPKFLWMWPQPCDPTVTMMGQSWSNFAPKPPPIGPVLLSASGPLAAYPGFTFNFRRKVGASWTPQTTTALERWVVFLNGGFDPAYVRGRGVAMVDAWTGRLVWDAFFEENPAPGNEAKNLLRYPITAGVAMTDIGPGELTGASDFFDGYFDTGNFGDLGGQLWTARFYEPGTVDAAGRATNWYLARAFQTERNNTTAWGVTGNLTNRRGISFITSNILQPDTGFLRSFFGTGDRNDLLGANGGICSLDTLPTCMQMGCQVEASYETKNVPTGEIKLSSKWNNGSFTEGKYQTKACENSTCKQNWDDACDNQCDSSSCGGALPYGSYPNEAACQAGSAVAGGCAEPCNNVCDETKVKAKVKVESCPNGTTDASGSNKLERELRYECKPKSGVVVCELKKDSDSSDMMTWKPSALAALPKHRFFGAHTFGGDKIFSDFAGSALYDAARLAETDLVSLGTLDVPSGSVASTQGRGWYINYNSVDERTASPANISASANLLSGCVFWNTLLPSPSAGVCLGAGNQSAKLIQGDVVTGSMDCAAGFRDTAGVGYRYTTRNVIAPPQEPTSTRALSGGSVSYQLITSEPGRDSEAVTTAVDTDMVQATYQLELTPAEHVCRHVTGGQTCGR